ncbi:helix-turn-helix domain-containing protein [Desertibaculum subflavum]|uniref:helix-turn-helix domain-containing protein n=1 Tax=Desertibaculum subflavum TaxID=2268458 RepID=UPI000E66E829
MTFPTHQRLREAGAPLFVSPTEAAKLLGIGRTKFYELLAAGEVEARRLGTRTLVDTASIAALADRLPRLGAAG